jgi:hypothetical protein
LVVDDSGDRKDGTATAHVGRQWLGRLGKTDNGVVTVTTLWADERVHYPLHAVPYTPARPFPKGRNDPGFRTKLRIGAESAAQAREAGFVFRAVAADRAYGDQDGFRGELREAGPPFVMALKPRHGTWAYGDRADWQTGNPAWGHCDTTALIVHDIFGGDLMVGGVHVDGEQHGFHWWNRLPSGVELDLTHEYFQRGEAVTAARVVERPPGPLPAAGTSTRSCAGV